MFSRFFIQRPIFASVISIVIVIVGLVAFRSLPIAQYPDIVPPTVSVTASYPGATAKVLSDTVAQPIEEQVNGVEGMIYMSSTCSNSGQYQLNITFATGTDLDMAAVRVHNRVSTAEPLLPEEVKRLGVTTVKQSPTFILIAALTSTDPRLDEIYLSNYAVLNLKNEIARLEGVGNVLVWGAGKYSMRIWLDPDKLKIRGMTTEDVVSAIRDQNVQVAAGQVGQPPVPDNSTFQYVINSPGRLAEVREFEEIIIKTDATRLTRLKDVARIELGAESYDITSRYNGKPSACLAVFQLPGANAIQVAGRVEAKMKELSRTFPQGLEYHIPFDTTRFIGSSIREVLETLLIASLLVLLVIFLFLQDWRASLIPAVTIPVCLIGTFGVMGMLGISLNMISLFAIVLAIGIVVDDAIVVVENASRHIDEAGASPREATIKAMGEVTGPIIATTLVLMAVFVPTAFLGGISGPLYRQFALTIATATAFSALNALTMSPALCAIVLRPNSGQKRNFILRAFNWTYDKGRAFYLVLLHGMVRRAVLMLPVFGLFAGAAYFGFISLPTGFLPSEDQGYAMLSVQLPDSASLSRTNAIMDKITRMLEKIPGVESSFVVSGYSLLDGSSSSNAAAAWVMFDDWDVREKRGQSLETMMVRLMEIANSIEDASVNVFPPPAILGVGEVGGFQLLVQDRGDVGLNTLAQVVQELTYEANGQTGLKNVFSMFRANVPQLLADVDRTQAKSLDVPLTTIFDTLETYLGALYVNDFNKFGRTYQVKVQADAPFRKRTEDIRMLEVRNNKGEMVPLGSLVNVRKTLGPQVINRYNTYPSASINGEPAPGYSSGEGLALMESMALSRLPASMGFEWTGIAYQEKITAGQAAGIFILAVIFVYLVLCAQYESWSIPLSVILVVPLGLLGTVAGLAVRALDVNLYTEIGIVLLIGMTCKTAILIVEFAKVQREAGTSISEAALEAARLRFRPIIMTAATFILGVSPLVIASGVAAGSRQALGTAVFGGMIAGTVLMVLFVPVFYVVIQRLSERLRGARKGTHAQDGRDGVVTPN